MKINKSKILEVRNLNVKYGPNQKSTLKNFKLDLLKGDHLAIIGPSGCGKTTFAKTIVNMLPEGSITEGYITICGEDITKIDKKAIQLFRRNNFGFIYQDSINKLNPLMTVGSHLYELFKIHYQNKTPVFINYLVEEMKIMDSKIGLGGLRLMRMILVTRNGKNVTYMDVKMIYQNNY